jgi:hypothetical protein
VARSINAADNRMINLFPEIVPEADDLMSMPYSLVATRQRFNVYAGNY